MSGKEKKNLTLYVYTFTHGDWSGTIDHFLILANSKERAEFLLREKMKEYSEGYIVGCERGGVLDPDDYSEYLVEERIEVIEGYFGE